MIPVDSELVPTGDHDMIKNIKMRVIDATEKVIGPPISSNEVLTRINRRHRDSKIVYKFAEDFTEIPKDLKEKKPLLRMKSAINLGTNTSLQG